MTTRQRRRVAPVFGSAMVAAATALTLIPPAVAEAQPLLMTESNRTNDAPTNLPPLITHYGAIAYSHDGSAGKARRHLSKLGAQQQALQRCGVGACTVVTTFTRCGAVAHDGATYHGGAGLSRGMAEANALSRLGGGWVVDWACN